MTPAEEAALRVIWANANHGTDLYSLRKAHALGRASGWHLEPGRTEGEWRLLVRHTDEFSVPLRERCARHGGACVTDDQRASVLTADDADHPTGCSCDVCDPKWGATTNCKCGAQGPVGERGEIIERGIRHTRAYCCHLDGCLHPRASVSKLDVEQCRCGHEKALHRMDKDGAYCASSEVECQCPRYERASVSGGERCSDCNREREAWIHTDLTDTFGHAFKSPSVSACKCGHPVHLHDGTGLVTGGCLQQFDEHDQPIASVSGRCNKCGHELGQTVNCSVTVTPEDCHCPEDHRQPIASVSGFDMLAHLTRQRDWSERTFGPGDRAKGVVAHIHKELAEIEAAPGDLTEWIDVVILALDGAWRSGASPQQIIDALVAKQTKNEGRAWPDWRTAPSDGPIEHDRSTEASVSDGYVMCETWGIPHPQGYAVNLRCLRRKGHDGEHKHEYDAESVSGGESLLAFLFDDVLHNLEPAVGCLRMEYGEGNHWINSLYDLCGRIAERVTAEKRKSVSGERDGKRCDAIATHHCIASMGGIDCQCVAKSGHDGKHAWPCTFKPANEPTDRNGCAFTENGNQCDAPREHHPCATKTIACCHDFQPTDRDPMPKDDYIERIARSYANEMERDGEVDERCACGLYEMKGNTAGIMDETGTHKKPIVIPCTRNGEPLPNRRTPPTDRNPGSGERDGALATLIEWAKVRLYRYQHGGAVEAHLSAADREHLRTLANLPTDRNAGRGASKHAEWLREAAYEWERTGGELHDYHNMPDHLRSIAALLDAGRDATRETVMRDALACVIEWLDWMDKPFSETLGGPVGGKRMFEELRSRRDHVRRTVEAALKGGKE